MKHNVEIWLGSGDSERRVRVAGQYTFVLSFLEAGQAWTLTLWRSDRAGSNGWAALTDPDTGVKAGQRISVAIDGEVILTGRAVKADEALQMGLVNRVVEHPLMDAAQSFAREFTGYGALALQFAREAVQRSHTASLADGLRIEADLSTLAYRTQDAEEGMQAFLERRPPVFKGQ